jgi:hypothetical protein
MRHGLFGYLSVASERIGLDNQAFFTATHPTLPIASAVCAQSSKLWRLGNND